MHIQQLGELFEADQASFSMFTLCSLNGNSRKQINSERGTNFVSVPTNWYQQHKGNKNQLSISRKNNESIEEKS